MAFFPDKILPRLINKILAFPGFQNNRSPSIMYTVNGQKRQEDQWLIKTYDSIDGHQLIASFQVPVLIRNAARNYTRYVDGRILLLATHHVEPKTFRCLGQLHYSRMSVAFACCKCCNCCLEQFKTCA